MRTLWLLIAALLVFADAIHAQVAAPRLNPVVGVPSNPAVLPWSGASRIGGGLFDEEAEDTTPPGPPTKVADGDGQILQARWVGENFAFGAEAAQLEFDIVGGDTAEFDSLLVGVAFQWQEVFSVGIGLEKFEGTETDNATGASVVDTATLPLVGATMRFAEVIYIGAAVGDVTFKEVRGGQAVETDIRLTRVGVAYYWRDGSNGLHLEAYKEEEDPSVLQVPANFINAGDAPFTSESKSETDGFTVEVVFANILLGVEFITSESTEVLKFQGVPFATVIDEEEETTISVGWAPEEGLAITVAATESEDTDTVVGISVDTFTTDSIFLGVAWLF